MNIVTKTALANFRRNKSRNVLVGIAVLLTTILLSAVPMVLFGGFVIENEAIKEIYPTYHAMYRNVDGETAEKMAKDDRIKEIGFREDPAYMIAENEDVIISMVYADEMVCRENRLNLTKGRLPKKEDEIVVTRGLLEEMGLTGEIGDRITDLIKYQRTEVSLLLMNRNLPSLVFSRTAKSRKKKESIRQWCPKHLQTPSFPKDNTHIAYM